MTRPTLLPLVLLLISIAGGCGQSDSTSSSSAQSSGGSSSTQPTTAATTQSSGGALGIPANAPQVGIRPGTEATYKPVLGKFGGRIVRDTLGEPKSLNPITAGETSTTEYTARMFQGMTETNPFTGEARPLIAEKYEVAPDGLTWT